MTLKRCISKGWWGKARDLSRTLEAPRTVRVGFKTNLAVEAQEQVAKQEATRSLVNRQPVSPYLHRVKKDTIKIWGSTGDSSTASFRAAGTSIRIGLSSLSLVGHKLRSTASKAFQIQIITFNKKELLKVWFWILEAALTATLVKIINWGSSQTDRLKAHSSATLPVDRGWEFANSIRSRAKAPTSNPKKATVSWAHIKKEWKTSEHLDTLARFKPRATNQLREYPKVARATRVTLRSLNRMHTKGHCTQIWLRGFFTSKRAERRWGQTRSDRTTQLLTIAPWLPVNQSRDLHRGQEAWF